MPDHRISFSWKSLLKQLDIFGVALQAREHAVDFETLWQRLKDGPSFLSVREVRGDLSNTVHFSEQRSVAENYAQYAPEYLYEGREIIYRLKHPEVPEIWGNCDELLWSLFRPRIDDPPVVLTVSFPADAISEKSSEPDQTRKCMGKSTYRCHHP